MVVFRLAKAKYKNDLSGIGAEKYGGRWNNKGTRMVYTAASRALTVLELAVHVAFNILPKNYHIVEIEIPENSILEFDVSLLKNKDWKSHPPIEFTQSEGDTFILENAFLGLKVPSAIVAGDFNYLLNPLHPDFDKVKITETAPFAFDERLFQEFGTH
ncbi:MAG: RES family NAD+ phosphorylase [Bacteroidota bacterium]